MKKGLRPIMCQKWVLYYIILIFIDFLSSFGGFWSFLEDLGPFFRLDLGEKLGGGYQLQAYIN
jgi:hypothetical protein